uniref:Uncharacterized protein n=2 Tax=Anguilla anguilla TaxID=7936 RepID=A0A0E9PEK4_ANGAN
MVCLISAQSSSLEFFPFRNEMALQNWKAFNISLDMTLVTDNAVLAQNIPSFESAFHVNLHNSLT